MKSKRLQWAEADGYESVENLYAETIYLEDQERDRRITLKFRSWIKKIVGWVENGTDSGLCLLAGFCISGAGCSGSAA